MQPEIDQQACEGEEERWGARQACGGRTGVITAGSWLAAASWKVHPGRRVSVVIPPGLGSFRLRRPQHTELTHETCAATFAPSQASRGQCRLCTPHRGSLGIGAVLVKRAGGEDGWIGLTRRENIWVCAMVEC